MPVQPESGGEAWSAAVGREVAELVFGAAAVGMPPSKNDDRMSAKRTERMAEMRCKIVLFDSYVYDVSGLGQQQQATRGTIMGVWKSPFSRLDVERGV